MFFLLEMQPLPDSLNTLLEFMTRMEQSFAQNGISRTLPFCFFFVFSSKFIVHNEWIYALSGYQPNSSSPNLEELGPNARGLPSQEALSIVLRHAERLLGGQSVAAISVSSYPEHCLLHFIRAHFV